MTGRRNRRRAALLIAPLALFLGVFFFWPLATMLAQSVSDPAVGRVLPLTSAAIADWDGQGVPPPEIQRAFATDLHEATDDLAVGDMVRRLNSAQSGFRSLMNKTLPAVREDVDVDLASLDRKWSNPAYWQAIRGAVSPLTDRNLLATMDLERNAGGEINRMPAGSSANGAIILRTLVVSAIVTLCCLLIGLPYAMIAASVTGWRRAVLLGAVLLPLWTSLLVRTAAWFILLQDSGLINGMLTGLGIVDQPVQLIFNRLGVVIAMTHVLLPFMVLPIYSVLATIPANLMPAAASLGARPLRAFWRVLLPLALRGILSGVLLVFMTAIGYYITPALVGGANDQMISAVITQYATGSANWGMAAALGVVLLALTLVLYACYGWLSREDAVRLS
ncbi:ABC transporter permease [Paracoccus aeridis]|uniref:ABC transporter permease n=1 Tax=Paracoccus aeridis TaxID=1966466 RepID=UPI0010A9CE88|nr:ABC transporter permease [Paracoccus aeridis]